ncbi:MAG TPA: 30S ribosomal protein S21 [Thermodesulfovibrionales bacterium]|nr:30S ribosomal protein S21 [Thermodesulfovibrionales bacterium]
MEIKVIGNDVEGAIKLLKRKIQRDGLLRDLKERRFYEKPSVKTKRKQREAQKRKRKSIRMRSQSRSAGKPS